MPYVAEGSALAHAVRSSKNLRSEASAVDKEPIPIRARLRRWYVPGAIYFITTVTHGRRLILADEAALACWRETLHAVQPLHPFRMLAYAFLPDHVHLLIRISPETDISQVMASAKGNFVRNWRRVRPGAGPLWQKSFWEHVIRDEEDFAHKLGYIHFNPCKHGLVTDPVLYPHSSLGEYIHRRWYGPSPVFKDLPLLPTDEGE
jgi:putative transposase